MGPTAAPGSLEGLRAWGLAALLVAPSVAWVVADRAVWSWDPAFYAMDTLDLWFRLANRPGEWLERMQTVFVAKAPGIAWLGQLFVPLGRWLGSIELGLLLSVLLVQAGTLVLVFRVGRRIAPGSRLPALVGTLAVAASPLFVAMSHHYMTEGLQLFAVAYVAWVAAESSSLPAARAFLHLALATTVGVLAKMTTPVYLVLPGLLAAAAVAREAVRGGRPRLGGREAGLGAALAGLVALAIAWFARNGAEAWAFAKLAASSDVALDYGSRRPLVDKLAYWAGAGQRELLGPVTAALAAIAAVAACALVARRRRRREPSREGPRAGALAAAAAAQIALVLLVLARADNEETRFLLALAPMAAVVLIWSVQAVGDRRFASVVALLLGAQWGVVHATQLGLLARPAGSYWMKPPAHDASRRLAVSAVVERTCTPETAGEWMTVGVDLDWLNHYTLMFTSAKRQLDRGFRCYYAYLGHAARDADAAFARLEELDGRYFISLEAAALPDPPDFLNQVSLAVLQRVERDARYVREPQLAEGNARIAVFRRAGP